MCTCTSTRDAPGSSCGRDVGERPRPRGGGPRGACAAEGLGRVAPTGRRRAVLFPCAVRVWSMHVPRGPVGRGLLLSQDAVALRPACLLQTRACTSHALPTCWSLGSRCGGLAGRGGGFRPDFCRPGTRVVGGLSPQRTWPPRTASCSLHRLSVTGAGQDSWRPRPALPWPRSPVVTAEGVRAPLADSLTPERVAVWVAL